MFVPLKKTKGSEQFGGDDVSPEDIWWHPLAFQELKMFPIGVDVLLYPGFPIKA